MADSFLTAYDANGKPIVRIAQDGAAWKATNPPSTPVCFSRLVLTDPAAAITSYLIDVLPAQDGKSSVANTLSLQFAPGSSAQVTQVSFRGRVRCYLNQASTPWLEIFGVLQPDTSAGTPLFQQLQIGEMSFPPFPATPVGQTISLLGQLPPIDLPVASQLPLLSEMGLTLGSTQRVSVAFVSAPRPAPPNASGDNLLESIIHNPNSNIQVLQFARPVTLATADQSMRAGLLDVEVDQATVERAQLNTRNATSSDPSKLDWPIWLIQTHLPLNSDGKLAYPTAAWVVSVAGLPHLPMLRAYNKLAERYCAALQSVQDGRPVSGVPIWEASDWKLDPTLQDFEHDLLDFCRPWAVTLDVADNLLATAPLDDAHVSHATARFRAAFLIAAGDFANPAKLGTFRAYIGSFPAIACHNYLQADGSGILRSAWQFKRSVEISPIPDPTVPIVQGVLADHANRWASLWRGFAIEMYLVKQGKSTVNQVPLQHVRFGALDLDFANTTEVSNGISSTDSPNLDSPRQQSLLTLGLRGPRGDFGELPTAALDLRFRVENAYPGGQDGLPNETTRPVNIDDPNTVAPDEQDPSAVAARFVREPALVIPLGSTNSSASSGGVSLSSGALLLRMRETTAMFQSQQLGVQLFQWSDQGVPTTDSSMRLVVVDRQPLLVAQVVAPSLVGIGGADGDLEIGNWLSDSSDGASWQLGGATDGFVVTLPPQAVGESEEKQKNIQERNAAKCRLGPSTNLRLVSTFFRQNFTEAVWNLRRLLGYVGQQTPGIPAEQLDFELLYGMGCDVRTPGLRLAELASRIGAVPDPLPVQIARLLTKNVDFVALQDRVFQRLQFRWSRQYASYASRLGIFEVWSESQPGTLQIDDRVNFQLRDPANIMQDPTVAPDPNDTHLDGGALWGMDFKAEYDPFTGSGAEALKTRKSTYGELIRPAFSALGGWGYQKAVFGLTTIYSDTAMGRTFFYSVERKGRIAGFWNFAKHVVVFERTVGSSQQFGPGMEQSHLAGRPVLRKVREYVELVQPARSYPDRGAGEVTRGCVLGIDFKSKIIPVDGKAWGHDVFDATGTAVGFVIPLWQLGADPAIYPKPHVALRIAGASDPAEDLPFEIDEPQKLLFYSPAVPPPPPADPENSDTWPTVLDVDYPDLAYPTAPAPNINADSDIEAKQPDAPATEPGFDAYTYAVVSHKPANMVATRTGSTLGAALHNVTMVRSSPAALNASGQTQQFTNAVQFQAQIGAARSTLNGLLDCFSEQADTKTIAARLTNNAKAFAAAMASAKDAASKAFDPPDPAGITKARSDAWNKRIRGTLDSWRTGFTDFQTSVNRFQTALAQIPASMSADDARTRILGLFSQLSTEYDVAVPNVDAGVGPMIQRLTAVCNCPEQVVKSLLVDAGQFLQQARQLVGHGADALTAAAQSQLVALAADTARRLKATVNQTISGVSDSVKRVVDATYTSGLSSLITDANGVIDGWSSELNDKLAGSADDINKVLDTWDGVFDDVKAKATTAVNVACSLATTLTTAGSLSAVKLADGTPLDTLINGDAIKQRFLDAIGPAQPPLPIDQIMKAVNGVIADLNNKFMTAIPSAGLDAVAQGLSGIAGVFVPGVKGDFDQSQIQNNLDDWTNQLQSKLLGFDPTADVNAFRDTISDLVNKGQDFLGTIANQAAGPLAAQFPGGVMQAAGDTLRLVRAFGDAPLVNGMTFNRDRLAYYFDPAKAIPGSPIDITPATALVNRAGDYLKAAGVSLPTGQLLDQVLPLVDDPTKTFSLKDFDFGKLLPDFAGLKLDNLLPDLKAPDGLADKVKITQGFDQQAGRGWVQADIDIPIDKPQTLFDAGPIKITLTNIDPDDPDNPDDFEFTARMRIETGLSGTPKRTQSGRLLANWDMSFGGTSMVTFVNTALSFDDSGKTRFDLKPQNVRMNGVLKMLSDALQAASDPDDGFTLTLIERDGFPAGVEARLELALPPVSAGPSSLSNLSFGAKLELVAFPDFLIGVRVHVAEKTKPFTLIVFILGGGGWLVAEAKYYPFTSRTITAVSIGLNAGAMLAIGFGPVNGSVYAFFYVEGELQTDSAQPGSQHLTIRIGLLLGGEVDVAGLITVSIQLLLELEYSNPDLVGRGTLSVHVKICFFLSINISMTVEKRFSGGGNPPPVTHKSVDAHLDQMS